MSNAAKTQEKPDSVAPMMDWTDGIAAISG